MHPFSVNIRICQPENSGVHQGIADVNIILEVWLILMLTEIVLLYYTAFLYSIYIFIYLFTQVRLALCTENKIVQQQLFMFLILL